MSEEQPQKQENSEIGGFFRTLQGRIIAFLGIISLIGGIITEGVSIWRNINETITSRQVAVNAQARQDADTRKAKADYCIALIDKVTKYSTLEELQNGDIDLGDCDPHYAEKMKTKQACAEKFTAILDKYIPAEGFNVPQKLTEDIETFKKDCRLTTELNDTLKARIGVVFKRIQDFEASNAGKACHDEVPKIAAMAGQNDSAEQFTDAIKKHSEVCPPMTEAERNLITSAINDAQQKAKLATEVLTIMKLQAEAKAENEKGNFDQAFKLSKQYAEAAEAFEVSKKGKPGNLTGGAYGNLSFSALFAKEYTAAIAAADRANELLPGNLVPQTNRAHGLMFLGRVDEARRIYLAHRGEKMGEHDWDYYVLDDFKQLRKAGLTHPLMDEIESAFQHPAEKQAVAVEPAAPKSAETPTSELKTFRVISELSEGKLSLRDGPGINHTKLAEISAGTSLRQAASCVNPDDGVTKQPWCKVDYQGTVGWVSMSGLREETSATPLAHDAASTADSGMVLAFLDAYHQTAASDMSQIGKYYGQNVDYGARGIVSREYIVREKAAVVQACPRRSYRILDDSIQIHRLSENRIDVFLDIDTLCAGGEKSTRRVWQSYLALDLSKGAPLIVAQKGAVRPSN